MAFDFFGLFGDDEEEQAPTERGTRPLTAFVTWCDSVPGETKVEPVDEARDRPVREVLKSTPLAGLKAFVLEAPERPLRDADPGTFAERYAAAAASKGKGKTSEASDAGGRFTFAALPVDRGPLWIGIEDYVCADLPYLRHRTGKQQVWRRGVALDRLRFVWELRWKDGRWQIRDTLSAASSMENWVDLATQANGGGFVFRCLKVLPYEAVPNRMKAIGDYPTAVPSPPYGLYRGADGKLKAEPERPDARRPPIFIEIPRAGTELPAPGTEVDLVKRTWLRKNLPLASFVYGKTDKKGVLVELKCRYVPVMKSSLLDKLVILSELVGDVRVTRGFVPPSDPLARAPIQGKAGFDKVTGVDTTGWLDRHAFGDAVNIGPGKDQVTTASVAADAGFDVVRFDGADVHVDDRGYKLFTLVFSAPNNRDVTWPQFDEVDKLEAVLGEASKLLHYVPRQFGGKDVAAAKVVVWDTNYYNQFTYADLTPTTDQAEFAQAVEDRGCGPTSQRMQLEALGRHPAASDRADTFVPGQVLSRKFILDDYILHLQSRYPRLPTRDKKKGEPASLPQLLHWATGLLGLDDGSSHQMGWAFTRSFFAVEGDEGFANAVPVGEMRCAPGRTIRVAGEGIAGFQSDVDYRRDHFDGEPLTPLGLVEKYIGSGPIQIMLFPPQTDATSHFRRERANPAQTAKITEPVLDEQGKPVLDDQGKPKVTVKTVVAKSNPPGASAHYVLVAGYAEIAEAAGAPPEKYIILMDSGVYTGRLILHKAETLLKSWTHVYANSWCGAAACYANAVYRRPARPDRAGKVRLTKEVGPDTGAPAGDVKAVQERLVELGFQVGKSGANGVFTKAVGTPRTVKTKSGTTTVTDYPQEALYTTEGAIKRFQFASFGTEKPDGIVAPESATLRRLNAWDAVRWVPAKGARLKFKDALQNSFHPRMARLLGDLGAWAEKEGVDLTVAAGSEGFPGDGRHKGGAVEHYRGLAATLVPSAKTQALGERLQALKLRELDVRYLPLDKSLRVWVV